MLLKTGDPFDLGIALRMLTDEYGTGSGRPRRLGALDLSKLADTVRLHGVDELYLNKCDSLAIFRATPSGLIPIFECDSETSFRWFPSFSNFSNECLPAELLQLIQFIEEQVGCRVAGIGTGPGREDIYSFL
jgi:adenylosuccinate synthase